MKLLFLGDIVGRAAREAVMRQVPIWRKQYELDFVVVNGENAAGGFGITPAIAEDLFEATFGINRPSKAISLTNRACCARAISPMAHRGAGRAYFRPEIIKCWWLM